MAAAAPAIKRQIPFVIEFPADEASPDIAGILEELRSIRNEIKGYTERFEAAANNEQLFWTEEGLADLFDISPLTVKRLRRAGKIKFKRVAGKAVFTKRHLAEFLDS